MLNEKEITFIKTMAKDFIGSYSSLNGEINLQYEDEQFTDQILSEISVCKNLLKKLGDANYE